MYYPQNRIGMYQNRVLTPTEIVRYDQVVTQTYPPHAIQNEVFVGFRVLLLDNLYNPYDPATRLRQIDSALPSILAGSGCALRETKRSLSDNGLWLVSFPVPLSQLFVQLANMRKVMQYLEQYFGITATTIIDISVSGRTNPMEFMTKLNMIFMPQKYLNMFVKVVNQFPQCPYGYYFYINDEYMLLRSRIDISHAETVGSIYDSMFEYMDTITNKLSTIFR